MAGITLPNPIANTTGLSFTSPSFTPGANDVIIVAYGGAAGGGSLATPSITDTLNGGSSSTWTALTAQGGAYSQMAFWYTQAPASPVAGTVTTAFAAGTGLDLQQVVVQVDGGAASSPVAQSLSGTTFSTTSTTSFSSAPAMTSAVVGITCAPIALAGDPTPPTGFYELGTLANPTTNNATRVQVSYIIGNGPTNVTWMNASSTNYQAVFEVAVGAGFGPMPNLISGPSTIPIWV